MTQEAVTSKVDLVRTQLLNLIDQTEEGAALPSERILAARFQVARMTLRRAMDDLAFDGLIVRQHGRGVFTARPKVAGRLAVSSFSEDTRRRGLTPGTRVISFRKGRADRNIARQLRIPVNDFAYFYTRLRLADGVPMALQQCTLVADAVPDLTEEDLTGSLYESLERRFGVKINGATADLEAVMPDARSAELLTIPMSQPCIQLRGFGLDQTGRVVEIGRSLFRGDRYRLSSSFSRGDVGPRRVRSSGR
ncbi:GntR family transcriptional regulator [Microlunatus sp. GCM10028923]|uniref:GntR family transcriptional regulator n=1 Tax=Microlunatus sp. GCM10028923 TaxID=3273400 RepID=UPI00361E3AA5